MLLLSHMHVTFLIALAGGGILSIAPCVAWCSRLEEFRLDSTGTSLAG